MNIHNGLFLRIARNVEANSEKVWRIASPVWSAVAR